MRPFPTLLLACLLALAMPAATGTAESPADPQRDDRDPRGQQTSDGVPGEIAAPLPKWLRGPTGRTVRNEWKVAPGVHAKVVDERDRRGPVRYYLLTVNTKKQGLVVDYLNAGAVRQTAPVGSMVSRTKRAVAGVNGDFFDIGDTGAPLGIGTDRQRGALHGPTAGWNNAFYLDDKGRPRFGVLPIKPRLRERPDLNLTNVNSPSVRPGGVGAYNHQWGTTSGYRVTDGQTRNVRMVLIREGRVVRNSTKLTTGQRIDGVMLVGRGAGARALVNLKRGKAAHIRWHVHTTPQMAITGNRFLVRQRRSVVVDDREMHPRTAVGFDRDTNRLLFLVVDGRQQHSRGYTMVELANKMLRLGAEAALNLDGGGSSTMLGLSKRDRMRVINHPSDGAQRSVANGIVVTYRKP